MALLFAFAILVPNALNVTLAAANRTLATLPDRILPGGAASYRVVSGIAPLFTPEVQYWSADIERWALAYDLDPNLLATVMQIESCGHADVSSSAGAQGLFQVMPFHFSAGENQLDPETNAARGASFLSQCLDWAGGDPAMAMACYNGGPSVLNRPFASWAAETQRYYVWGATIYNDAQQGLSSSPSLEHWLNAGGASLCRRAAQNIAARS